MKIHYIVAFWPCQKRENPLVNETVFLKYHLRYARKTKLFDKITFVFNHCTTEIEQTIRQMVKNEPIEAIFRPNANCSYGAWEHAIIKNIEEDFDYHFLSEDDYLAIDDSFLQLYLNEMTEEHCYVCGLIHKQTFQMFPNIHEHAGVSNGLLNHQKVQQVFKKEKRIFDLSLHSLYCWENQVTFLNYLRKMGKLTGVATKCKTWFEVYNKDLGKGTSLHSCGKGNNNSHVPANFWIKHHKLL